MPSQNFIFSIFGDHCFRQSYFRRNGLQLMQGFAAYRHNRNAVLKAANAGLAASKE